MKKNKIIAFLVFVFVFSLLNTKQIFAAEIIQDVAPFSNEIQEPIVDVAPFSDEIKTEPIKTKIIEKQITSVVEPVIKEEVVLNILTPYYYADDSSTYVIRGYANTGSKIEVYVDDIKVRFIDSLYGTKATSYFALAVRNLKEGNHKAYVLSYAKDSDISFKSKVVYFEVSKADKGNIDAKETKKEETKKDAVKPVTEVKKETKKDIKTNNVNVSKEKQDKSILIGIILLIIAVILIIFWLASENKEKMKKFIDNLFEEDDDDDKKNDENK